MFGSEWHQLFVELQRRVIVPLKFKFKQFEQVFLVFLIFLVIVVFDSEFQQFIE